MPYYALAAAGEYVIDIAGAPVGRIEGVLETSRGVRLVVARAFTRGSFSVLEGVELTGREVDARGVAWHRIGNSMEAVLGRGSLRREMGRLVADPFPAPFGAPQPDGDVERELRDALEQDWLTKGARVETSVVHGVAVLEGLIGTVGGKVAAERLARTTAGVWDVINRLFSDEELLAVVRSAVRRAGNAADVVHDVRVAGGEVRLTLLPDSALPDPSVEDVRQARLRAAVLAVPGVRGVVFDRVGSGDT